MLIEPFHGFRRNDHAILGRVAIDVVTIAASEVTRAKGLDDDCMNHGAGSPNL
jgi:hypothetical protein